MSQKYASAVGNETVVEVNASTVAEVITLPAWTSPGRSFRIRRIDSGGQTATVVPSPGFSIDGVVDATKTVPANTEVRLDLIDPGQWESYGFSTGGGGAVSSVAGQVGDVSASQLATAISGTYASRLEALKAWALTAAFSFSSAPTVNGSGTITGGPILWPDAATGVYTATGVDANGAVTAFTATTTGGPLGSKTVTVSIPRDANSILNGAMTVTVS